ncbi:hypothetical protein I4552_26100 [Klebsiella michiganensis]|uniref:ECs1072 family phage-associated protein n=1 Tax=Klebsiella michiganensis TaxID=1134687 RepID=UPI0018C4A53C|nr:hypothetical protein [Klebsiella michiganensis]MBG2634454.1 hypothetical protein [Klebsiella michiganensis]
MSVLQSLFESHARNIARAHGWHSRGETLPTFKAWLRAEQLVRLDMLLAEHREEYSSLWEPLLGKRVLTHFLHLRTGWSPEQISQLSLDDALLLLQQDLVVVNIPGEELLYPAYVQAELQQLIQCSYQIEWPPHLDEEWDPSFCEIALGLRKPS